MLCERCQSFWREVASGVEIRGSGDASTITRDQIRWPHHSTTLHSDLAQLRKASDRRCPICRTICFTPTEHERLLLTQDCLTVLQLNAQDSTSPTLSVRFDSKDGHILVPTRMVGIYSGLLYDDELASTLAKCSEMVDDSTGSDAALTLASFWLNQCLSTHEECARAPSSTHFMPSRLIDVGGGDDDQDVQLIETNQQSIFEADRRYVALSHCWGQTKIITTDTDSYNDRLQGIKLSQLSKTFQHAVQVARRLSFRYIWIDSLCIVQNDYDDWVREAAQMCNIYRNAVFTIAAAHATGGDVGCFEERDGLQQFPFVIDLCVGSVGQDAKRLRVSFTSCGRAKIPGGSVAPLYGRAWALQELILSPRVIVFDGPQIRWACLRMHGSEGSPSGGTSRHAGSLRNIRYSISNGEDFFKARSPESDANSAAVTELRRRFGNQDWCYTVMDYTHRGMTKCSDRLAAIAGIADALGEKTTNKYLAGIWNDYLWLGLLWSIPHDDLEYTPTVTGAFDVERNQSIRHEESLAPSWSWVSVTAPVVYPPLVVNSGHTESTCEIQMATVDGSTARKSGTLTVRGHVREAYVNSIYPDAIREAATTRPEMTFRKPDSSGKVVPATFCRRTFHPNDYFLMSATAPHKEKEWQLMPGQWRPDEVLDPLIPVLFLAVAQLVTTQRGIEIEGSPLQVYAIGLVATGGAEGEYRRVGYGVWDFCTWYGYTCDLKEQERGTTGDAGGWRHAFHKGVESFSERLKGRGRPYPKGPAGHDHEFEANALPRQSVYHKAINVQEKTVTII